MFEQFGLRDNLLKGLERLGMEKATPIQQEMIPAILAGKDVQASAETGSGKSAAFLLPLLQHVLDKPAADTATRCLVLSPTRELAMQLDKHCQDLAKFTQVRSQVVTGGTGLREQQALLRKNPEFVIGTPGRILEHAQKGSLDLSDLESLVLDEADRMLDMGFRDDVQMIAGFCKKERQTILLSATLNHKGAGGISKELQSSPQQISFGTHRKPHDNIRQEIILADDPTHKRQLCSWLLANEEYKQALVFTNTRIHAEELAVFLIGQGRRTACLQGEMLPDERKQVMSLFREGRVKVLVATDLAARGLDVAAIDLVINFAMARSGDDYVHRIGRTGRAGETGKAISLIGPKEWNLMESIARYLNLEFIRREIEEMPARFAGPSGKKKAGKGKDKRRGKKESKDKNTDKTKQRHRNRRNIGKRRAPAVKGRKPETENSLSAEEKPKKKAKVASDTGGLLPLRRK